MRPLIILFALGISICLAEPVSLREQSPPKWIALGLPAFVDRSKEAPRKLREYVNRADEDVEKYKNSARASKVIEEHAAIFRHFLTPREGEKEHVHLAFSGAADIFAGTPFQAEMASLIRPRLRHPIGIIRAFAATQLAILHDQEAVPEMLPLLVDQDPQVVKITRKALRKLGYELPFEEEKPQPLPRK